MLLKRLFIALYGGLLLYTLLMVTMGPSGYDATTACKDLEARMEGRLGELRDLNQVLRDKIATLRTSSVEIKTIVKSLGYFEEGDRVLILPSGARAKPALEAGDILLAEGATGADPRTYAMLAALFTIAAFVALSLRSGPRRRAAYSRGA